MKIVLNIFVLLLLAANAWADNDARRSSPLPERPSVRQGDSIMRNVIAHADRYRTAVSRYEAEIYIKGKMKILKQNFLMRFAHHILPVDRKTPDMIFEMVSNSEFNAPNSYLHHFEAINGNSIPNEAKQKEILTFLNLNVYSPTIYNEGIIMPVAREASKFYRFDLESVEETQEGLKIFNIRFMPRWWSQKLISGNLYILDKEWRIDKIDINGHFSFAEFNIVMTFGRDYRRFALPQHADLSLQYKIAGNTIACSYHTAFKYKAVEWVEEDHELEDIPTYNLTGYYQLSADTIPIIRNTSYWADKRDRPLTLEERITYNYTPLVPMQESDSGFFQRSLKMTRRLTNTVNLDYKTTRLKYSGLLNPFQLGYSGRDGITYRQQLRLSKTFDRDRQLRFNPELGFVFKRKEIFFRVGGEWEYKPERMGVLSLNVGNSNQGFSSRMMGEINEQLKDSAFNFDNLNLEYFKHYYIELKNRHELFNGLQLFSSLSYHRRVPANKSAIDPGDEVNELITEHYNDFLLTIGFSYTPGQYYWYDGYRKEYLRSRYPTFSFEFGRAIPNVFGSNGNYGRIEADVHQSIPLGLSRKFNYHIGGGIYTAQKSTYFADFRYFTRHYFPESWDDNDFGGVFHQLRSEWFNASDKYVQLHLMYESPFIFFQLMKPKASKYVLSERFYVSQLWMPIKPNYTELGYGFGNHLFNVAMFVALDRMRYDGFGFKFAFELFQ